MHEILGQSPFAPWVFGNNAPDSGNAELLAIGIEHSGREEQRARWLEPLLDGRMRSGFSMTEPGAGADPTMITTTAVRDGDEWVDRRPQVVHHQRVDRRLPHRHGGHQPRRPPLPGVLDDRRAGRHPGRRDRARRRHDGGSRRPLRGRSAATPRSSTARCASPTGTSIGREGEGFVLAQQRLGPGRIHHCMRWLGQSKRAFDMLCERAVSRTTHGSTAGREADGPELGRRLAGRDDRGPAHDPARRLEDGPRGRGGRPVRRSR